MKINLLLITTAVITLSSCNSIPKSLQGEFANLTPGQSKADHIMDQAVRWSGLIIKTNNYKDKTCFEVVETETTKTTRPKKTIAKDSSRFLACKDGFMEPHAFDKRLVTITGKIVAYTENNVGEFNYEYPVVETDVIYIWRDRPPAVNPRFNYSPFLFGPFSCRYSIRVGYCF